LFLASFFLANSGFSKPAKFVFLAFVSVCLNWLWVVFIHIHCSVFKDQSAFQQRRLFYQIFIFLSSIIFHTWFDFVCCFFDSEWYFIKYHSVCQALFYLFFCACFRCLCQRISVYHPQSRLSMFFFSNIRCWPMPILFFRLLSCSDIYLLYTLSRKCQHLFSLFDILFFRLNKI